MRESKESTNPFALFRGDPGVDGSTQVRAIPTKSMVTSEMVTGDVGA